MSRDGGRLLRARRTLVAVAAASLVFALTIALGWKGLLCELGGFRVSVRAARNPLVLAVASLLAAWIMAPSGQRTHALGEDLRSLWRRARSPARGVDGAGAGLSRASRAAPVVAAVVAIAVVVVAVQEGAPIAAGSDASGYVSQAHLWATGKLRVEPPLLRELEPVLNPRALAPLGYIVSDDGATLVPTYSPGLPMTMAVFERIGGRRAVFWVVPLLGGVAIWASYLLGRRIAGPWCGAFAAVLVASSPAFLFQLTSAPMSDLAAAAWWTLSLALLLSPARGAALASGVVAGVAILTRPNLVPVAIVPGVLLLWQTIGEWRGRAAEESRPMRPAARRLLAFLAGVVPGCLAVAAIDTHLYGGPLASGYDLEGLFAWEHALPNLARYPVLATEMHTPLIWLGMVAPLLFASSAKAGDLAPAGRSAAWASLWLALAVFACYLFYPGFDSHERFRFLVPAVPALLVLTSAGTLALARRLSPRRSTALAAAAIAMAAWHGVTWASSRGAFALEGERKYALIGDYITHQLPERAVLFAMQHSGSIRYYTDRGMVRYDQVPKGQLDVVVATLRDLGYHSYLVLEAWEEAQFRERFQHRSALGSLDWPPLLKLDLGDVRIYDTAERELSAPSHDPVTRHPNHTRGHRGHRRHSRRAPASASPTLEQRG